VMVIFAIMILLPLLLLMCDGQRAQNARDIAACLFVLLLLIVLVEVS